ncbi:hypothetical protein M378DRAFT_602471 [Amanita muscaria Koide BX008]|uniref:Uncharacterized protein n=1 Tax=Amanita muscaria (strain Koide BX008) TaxID=946122 RepID=A0A0C2XLW0_AMAMK|nr:hypothetical protein M378DRAFT_602471 [Amanita muscaria Koide BX008]
MNTPKENSEVIDLTGSSPISSRKLVDLTLGDTPSNVQDASSPVKRKSHRRKKKKPQSGVNSQTNTANTTRAPSTEATGQDPSEKHDDANASQLSAPQPSPRQPSPAPESGPSQWFYVDTSPTTIPPGPPLADHLEKPPELERQSAPSTSNLLLPAHVQVFGSKPSSIPAPSQKELDEEDYIEYLDYDEYKVSEPKIFSIFRERTLR